jgi:hypothetical protein
MTSPWASPSAARTAARAAGSSASPSRLGHRIPQESSSQGNAPKPTLSKPASPTASGESPASWRMSSTHPSGQTTSAMVTERMFAAAGTEIPVIITNSDPRACQAAG